MVASIRAILILVCAHVTLDMIFRLMEKAASGTFALSTIMDVTKNATQIQGIAHAQQHMILSAANNVHLIIVLQAMVDAPIIAYLILACARVILGSIFSLTARLAYTTTASSATMAVTIHALQTQESAPATLDLTSKVMERRAL